jgi:hypothetical protein
MVSSEIFRFNPCSLTVKEIRRKQTSLEPVAEDRHGKEATNARKMKHITCIVPKEVTMTSFVSFLSNDPLMSSTAPEISQVFSISEISTWEYLFNRLS